MLHTENETRMAKNNSLRFKRGNENIIQAHCVVRDLHVA